MIITINYRRIRQVLILNAFNYLKVQKVLSSNSNSQLIKVYGPTGGGKMGSWQNLVIVTALSTYSE